MYRIALGMLRGGMPESAPSGGGASPRSYLFDEAFLPVLDEFGLRGSPSRWSPSWWQLAGEIQRRHAEYDAIVTWGEKLSLALLLQQSFANARKPHVAMMYQFEKANIKIPLSLLKRNLHAVVTWSSVQRQALIESIGYPAERVYLVRHYVDQVFYSPYPAPDDMICAVGAEMRDYATLKQALRGTGIPCHIAADHVRIPGRFRLLADRRVPVGEIGEGACAGVTVGRLSLPELRNLYARSRFVVIPLFPSDTDNGVTCILQAMAMGKPVICSSTRGQVDVIQNGVNGVYVPVGDPLALRAAMLSLWNDPEKARQMGENGRAYVEQYHTLEMFTESVRSAVEASLDGIPATDSCWAGARPELPSGA